MEVCQIVTELARTKRVETIVRNVAHQSGGADVSDLSQMIYEIILDYDPAKIVDLYENRQLDYFIARVAVNQFRSGHSAFHKVVRAFRERSTDIDALEDTR